MSKIQTFKLNSFLVLIAATLLLVGCSSGPATSKEAFEKSQEAMGEIDSVRVDLTDNVTDDTEERENTYTFQIDYEEDIRFYEDNKDNFNILVKDDVAIINEEGYSTNETGDVDIITEAKDISAFTTDPLSILEELDDEVIEKFIMETEGEEIILTFDDEDPADLAAQLFIFLTSGFAAITDDEVNLMQERGLNELTFEIVIDKSDYLLKDMQIVLSGKQDDKNFSFDYKYKYSKYNEAIDISASVETENEEIEPVADIDIDEEDAAAYLDALILATVYQDVDGYLNALPEFMQNADSQGKGELQRDMFKSFYVENTKQNMDGYGIEDEEFEALGDAFVEALKIANYEIVSTKIVDDFVVVTLTIEGINDSKVYAETEKRLSKVGDEEELEIEELVLKNIHILIDAYEDVEITNPIDVEVHVSKLDGEYHVMLQDQYLIGGFVQ